MKCRLSKKDNRPRAEACSLFLFLILNVYRSSGYNKHIGNSLNIMKIKCQGFIAKEVDSVHSVSTSFFSIFIQNMTKNIDDISLK